MITDHITAGAVDFLAAHSPIFAAAFDWLRRATFADAAPMTELRGLAMHVQRHEYDTKPADQCRWESHRHTFDIQFTATGCEGIDWHPAGTLPAMDHYDAIKDVEHWHADRTSTPRIFMPPGRFVIFFPGEQHRPKVHDGVHARVGKLVVKIDASLVAVSR